MCHQDGASGNPELDSPVLCGVAPIEYFIVR